MSDETIVLGSPTSETVVLNEDMVMAIVRIGEGWVSRGEGGRRIKYQRCFMRIAIQPISNKPFLADVSRD